MEKKKIKLKEILKLLITIWTYKAKILFLLLSIIVFKIYKSAIHNLINIV